MAPQRATLGAVSVHIRRASVVVPCFNYGHFVESAVASALDGGIDVEVIVIDDASTDGSDEVVRSLAQRWPDVRPILHEQNRGLVGTINHGLDVATGDMIVVLSADDLLTPGALARAAHALDAHPSAGMAIGSYAVFEGKGDPPPSATGDEPSRVGDLQLHHGREWLERRCRQGINLIASPEVAVRATAQREVGPYDDACRHTSDLNMWLRIAARFDVVHVGGAPLAHYRRHGHNMSAVEFGGLAHDATERWIAFDRALDTIDADDAAPLRASARSTIARDLLHETRRRARAGQIDQDTRIGLVRAAEEIDPILTARLTLDDDRIRPDLAARLRRRRRWNRWMEDWNRVGN